MNRIENLFKNQKGKVLNIYFTAGFPKLDSTLTVLKSLQDSGVDMVEIGLPFSDPLADGPTIQASGQKALKNGMSLKVLFEQLDGFRKDIHIPVLLMGYFNPVMQFGVENFLKTCKRVGVDGLILPDLPLSEYEKHYKGLFKSYGIDLIFLVTPETSDDRLKQIDQAGSGFIYAVSSSSTTGSDKSWNKLEAYFKHLEKANLNNPILTGFGVKDKESFQKASAHTNGAIIGTAFVKMLEQTEDLEKEIGEFVKGILK